MAKVVIDANVVISAAFGGNPLRAVIQAMEGHEVYLSEAIERELRGVFSKLSRKLTGEQIIFVNARICDLVGMAKQVPVSARVILSRDSKDDHYLSLCREVEADFLITGDRDLPSISPKALRENGLSCRILTPQEFVEGI